MRRTLIGLVALIGLTAIAPAQEQAGGGEYKPPRESQPCISEARRQEIRAQLQARVKLLIEQGKLPARKPELVLLDWPVQGAPGLDDYGYHGISNFVDQDPVIGSVLDWNCGTRSYDIPGYNHTGVDIFTWPFAWLRVDLNQVHVVAAAAGTIIDKADGNPDHNCGFGQGNWNAVYVMHADGSIAWYGHMKSGSLTPKGVGETVAQGEYLGVVGSSGNSTGPHLHLELYDGQGGLIEAYEGPCNFLNPASWWAAQRPYYDSAVNKVATHSAPPVFPVCPDPEVPNLQDLFAPGSTAYFVTYYREQLAGQTSQYTIRRPDDSVFASWSHSSPAPFYAASYWYWSYLLPGPEGLWRFEVAYQGQSYEHAFVVTSGATPSIDVSDVAVIEGDSDGTAMFTVTLSGASAQTVTVAYATANGTASAGSDYGAASGSLSFGPGVTSLTISVGVVGDDAAEADETLFLNLSAPTNATLGDGQGLGLIVDDDPPALSIDDVMVTEGDAGKVTALFGVHLSAPSTGTVTLSYATADGTASAGTDYNPVSGSLTFSPGSLSQALAVAALGDVVVEMDETFRVDLSAPAGAVLGDAQGTATIADDDAPSLSSAELTHGSTLVGDLAAQPGSTPDRDYFRLGQRPRSSYEVVVDGLSADLVPLILERLAADNVTVLQAGSPASSGSSTSLRWENAGPGLVTNQHLSVRSGGCGVSCDAADIYRIRVRETTGSIARFNNSGTQITIVVLQNAGDDAVIGTLWLWGGAGTLVGSTAFTLAPHGTWILNTATLAPGSSGSVTVSSDGRYGVLQGKAVSLEPATGFTFDTALLPRVK